MRWDNSELLFDSASEDLYDSVKERILARSDTLYVEDEVAILNFSLVPNTVAINSTFQVNLDVAEDFVEGEM